MTISTLYQISIICYNDAKNYNVAIMDEQDLVITDTFTDTKEAMRCFIDKVKAIEERSFTQISVMDKPSYKKSTYIATSEIPDLLTKYLDNKA